jgi:thiol-disulfide isomerase/thioredoxin
MESFWAIIALVAVSTLLGVVWKARQGRVRRDPQGEIPASLIDPDARLTILQFSGEFCSYCPLMRAHLTRAANANERVTHRELDIAQHVDLTAKLHILQTPTTLLVSPRGRVLARIAGVAQPKNIQTEITAALEAARTDSDDYLI